MITAESVPLAVHDSTCTVEPHSKTCTTAAAHRQQDGVFSVGCPIEYFRVSLNYTDDTLATQLSSSPFARTWVS